MVLFSGVWLVGGDVFSPPFLCVNRSSSDRGLNVVVDLVGRVVIIIIIIIMVVDLVGGVGGGGRLVNRFSDALVVVFEVGPLVLFVVAFVEVFFSSSFS